MPSRHPYRRRPRYRPAAIVLLATLSVFFTACGSAPATEDEATLRRGTVERGSIDVTVSTTGRVLPEEQVSLVFKQPGIVDEVLVEVGDEVRAGQALARLRTQRLETSLRQADLALRAQQLNYDRLFLAPSNAELAAARAGVDAAQANYQSIAAGADPESLWIGELQYERAYKQYEQAETTLKAVQPWLPEDQVIVYREQRDQALIGVEMSRLQLQQLQAGAGEQALEAARASITQAQAELNRLLAEPDELEAAQLAVQIEQARLALDRVERQLDDAVLRAPFAGVVAEVNIQAGSSVPGEGAAIVIVDNSRLHVDASVDEIDIARVMPGQPVVVTVDAAPGETISGQLVEIAPAAAVQEAVATYPARIDLQPGDAPLRIGMTATAQILTQRLEDVLLVPNWAIRVDRQTGQTRVSVLSEDGTLREVPVALGVHGDTQSEVIAGLEEGQVVAVRLREPSLTMIEPGGDQ